jgi:hypothetical protein
MSLLKDDGVPKRPGKRGTRLVVIVILNYNGEQMTLECVRSVLKIEYPNFRVVVVDNGSTDDSVPQLRTGLGDPRVELLVNRKNEGYAGGNNRGIEVALERGAEYVYILNNDVIVEPGSLGPLVGAMEREPKMGICGGPILPADSDGDPVCGQYFNLFTGVSGGRTKNVAHAQADVDFIHGAALLMRVELLRQIGGFDESFFLLFEDGDICLRAREAGWRVCYVPAPSVRHLNHATLKRIPRPSFYFYAVRNWAWFVRRHGRKGHRFVFGLMCFCYYYPRLLVGRTVKGDFASVGAVMRGIWEGHTWPVPPVTAAGPQTSKSRAGTFRRGGADW